MPILPEVQSYIIATATGFRAGGSTGANTPIFLGTIPATEPNRAVSLYETGGLTPQQTLNSTAVAFEQPSLQVINRSTSYAEAQADAHRIFRTLNGIINATLTGTPYVSVEPIQSPIDLRRDANDRQMFSCNYTVRKEES